MTDNKPENTFRSTYFAPPERADGETVARQRTIVQTQQYITNTLNAIPDITAVINRERQIIYSNDAFLEMLGMDDFDEILGKRPGEILGCLHADTTNDGCGNSLNCRFCGTTQVILESIDRNMRVAKECIISADIGGHVFTYDFLVTATPFAIENEFFTLLSFRDISHQKRRIALERIFFHDILNTASSLQIYTDLLKKTDTVIEKDRLTEDLSKMSDTLVKEINSHKLLVNAESGTLKVQNNMINIHHFVQDIIDQFSFQDIARGKTIAIEPFTEGVSMISDQIILERVVYNMVKNALEASPEGSAVTIGFTRHDDTVELWVDNPVYIEEDIQLQIFRRSFSTKAESRGLGTYSMKLLTEEYLSGAVRFRSTRDQGTRFWVILPEKQLYRNG